MFYATPQNDAQVTHNRAVLNDLKARCVADVRSFLVDNQALLAKLTTAISEQKAMNREPLAPYLARAVGVVCLPRAD